MSVDIKLLKQLRIMTHAPIKDCKSALEDVWNDFDAAKDWLRKKWASKAAKNAYRETNEGVVIIKKYEISLLDWSLHVKLIL